MNPNAPGARADLAAAMALSREKVHRAVVARIWELADGGLDAHEVARATGHSVRTVRAVLRGNPGKAETGR